MKTSKNFQVNLSGMIDLLSNHLYSGPHVFLRELLQNSVDAIAANKKYSKNKGEIKIEIIHPKGANSTLMFEDNGIGLTIEEVHEFLSTIGQSSKRGDLEKSTNTFIGQFGIGLLSCFMVSEEIVVITKSAKSNSNCVEWRGKSDGTYTTKAIENEAKPGTKVFLTATNQSLEYFKLEFIEEQLNYFGVALPIDITISENNKSKKLKQKCAPWQIKSNSLSEEKLAYKEFGELIYEDVFFDVIPISFHNGKTQGALYINGQPSVISAKTSARVYIKNMLINESVEDLLPEWAFFIKAIINSEMLKPLASREGLYFDNNLKKLKEELSLSIQNYILDLGKNDKGKLEQLIRLHYRAIKAISAENEGLCKSLYRYLPFQTNFGILSFQEIKEIKNNQIQYIPSVDEFRQISRVALHNSSTIINAGYSFDLDLLKMIEIIDQEIILIEVNPMDFSNELEELSLDDRDASMAFYQLACEILDPFGISVDIKTFNPNDIPAIFIQNEISSFIRDVELTKEGSDGLFDSALNAHVSEKSEFAQACLYFNFKNELISKMIAMAKNKTKDKLIKETISIIYVQSLMMGFYPLGAKELKIFNHGILNLIQKVFQK